MRFLGLEITRTNKALSPVYDNRGGWMSIIREPFAGAWQRNLEINQTLVPSFHAVFACITLIAGDIKKLRVKTIRDNGDGIWPEDRKGSPKTAVLGQPNQYQNSKQFWESWMLSKLMRGNTYALKGRDARGIVNRLWTLDPLRVKVLVSDSGDVFYELSEDNLTGRTATVTVPASEIIHDRMNTFFHPLVGLSPLYAAALAAQQGLNIQSNSTRFFGNRSLPGGILTAPHTIPDETAARLKDAWDKNFTGERSGGTAVLGDGLKFEAMAVKATDAQLLEQAKATAEWVCSAFHVPPYKIGVGPTPSYNNIQALNVEYYSQCLQALIEDAEECLDKGLELGSTVGIQFDLDGLLRMDTVSQVASIKEAVGAGIMSPNEARRKLELLPAEGGDTPYLQQQNYSLAALNKRDAREDPFAAAPTTAPAPADPPAPPGASKIYDDPDTEVLRARTVLEEELGLSEAA